MFNTKQDFNAAKNYQTSATESANLTSAQKSLTQNYNQASTGLTLSGSYPLKRHAFQRVGITYSLTKSSITAFSTASQTFFQTISFRSGIQGSNALDGIVNSSASFSYTYNTINNPMRPRSGKEYTAVFQIAGLGGNVRYFSPLVAYKSFTSMHYLTPSTSGRNVLGIRAQLGYVQGFGGDVAPPNNRFYSGGEAELRGFDIRGATPYGYVPNRTTVQLTNPDGTCVPRDSNNPQLNQCIQVPLPVYGVVSIGGDTNLTTNAEYRIPIAGPVTFSFFNDFGITVAANHSQLKQSPEGFASLTAPLYGCPVFNNGSCQGGIPGDKVGFVRDVRPVAGHQLHSTHVHRRRNCGHHADHQRALPPLLCVQPAPPLRAALLQQPPQREQAGQLHRGADYARHVPLERRGRLHLSGSDRGLRRALSIA